MNDRLHAGMREASRLTREGRLMDATVLLQRVLQSGRDRSPFAGNGYMPPTIEPAPEAAEITGAEPSRPRSAVRAHLPTMLRGFLDGITPTGFERYPGGLAEPSAPDASVPGGGQFLSKSFSSQAGSRNYKLYVPSQYRGQPLPLIVMLHGCTQSPDDFAAGTRMNLRAEEYNCFVAYPEQSASANISKCWNWFRPGDQIRGQGEPALIAGLTRQVISDYSVDQERIYAAGLSAGGAAVAVLAAAYPDLYAAIGVHSGLACGVARDVSSAFAAMRQSQPGARRRSDNNSSGRGGYSRIIPAIVFHGDQDTTVHPCNGDQVIAQLRDALAADVTVKVEGGRVRGGRGYTRTVHCDAADHSIFEQWVIHGAGHAWSGGSLAGSYTDPQGPDATREMLRFFLDHPFG
ncbi:MAG TPA: PHB depolymerase family esterase [Stellaceae bacterium]|jgi:poly(hydroxyalkanoate) depolymerase family esterase|nr:PHB depolymerase family esterase [Stellaceae bacterium]